jgi:hypothetical protein
LFHHYSIGLPRRLILAILGSLLFFGTAFA